MSAISRLWRRAPAWRFFLYACGFFLILGLIFPTPLVSQHMSWARFLTAHIPSFGQSSGQDERNGSSDNAPASPGSPENSSAQDGGPMDPARFITPDINTAIAGAVPFGGHSLPLPAGIWHPVLSGQFGANDMMSLIVLARTDRGIVTGVLIATTTSHDLPRESVEDAYNRCHDDRNYHSTVLAEQPDGKTECSYIASAFMGANASISPDPLIQLAFRRLSTLGFPMPSVFIVASWLNSSGANDPVKGSTAVSLLLAPTRAGTVVLRAPLPYWDRRMINQAPAALEFVRHVDIWFSNWVSVLRRGMTTDYSEKTLDPALARDPAAPE